MLFSLFVVAFISATLIPLGSEALLSWSVNQEPESWLLLWFVASVGNVLGAVVNWGLGRYFLHFSQRPWFPFPPSSIQRAQQWYERWGFWSLLFSWLPLVGDVLTLVAGVMRLPILWFIALTFLGKSARYGVLIYIVLNA